MVSVNIFEGVLFLKSVLIYAKTSDITVLAKYIEVVLRQIYQQGHCIVFGCPAKRLWSQMNGSKLAVFAWTCFFAQPPFLEDLGWKTAGRKLAVEYNSCKE